MKWNNMTSVQKVATVIACIAAAVWAVSEAKPDLFPVDLTCPAIAVSTMCEGVAYWKQNRKWSYLLIAAAVISLAFFVLDLFLI